MTFAFPAYHETTVPGFKTAEAIEAGMRKAGWREVQRQGSTITCKVGFNLWSFGETMAITLAPTHAVLRSTCILPTQCVDWGKNRRNVQKLLAVLAD